MSDKTNPLDRLTRPGGRSISDDESIPVLTERLSLPSLDLDISLPKTPPGAAPAPSPSASPSPPAAPPPAPPAAAPTPAAAAPAGATAVTPLAPVVAAPARSSAARAGPPTVPSYSSTRTPVAAEIDWARIESSLRDAVLRELQPVLADEVARVLRERLQPAVDRALVALTAELRQALDARLRESLARAVASEIERLRNRN
jgi:hypothetical protein